MPPANSLQFSAILIGLFGGLALFLFGMEQLTEALKSSAGQRMRLVLARLTTNRFTAAFAGTFVTAVIQSSSVTTVLVVGFVSAGLMTLTQSVGVIMGANVGTTITAQIIAFDVTRYALVLVAAGFAAQFFSKTERVVRAGTFVMGLGLVFFGMELMSESTRPLRSYQPFLDAMATMESPWVGILLAAAFTAIVQSSSATTGVIIALATQGFVTLEAGIALAFGSNIGTCVTALLASTGKPREAVRVAAVHILFNVAGVLIWLGLIDELAYLVRMVSPADADLIGAERMAAETPRQIANAHTLFNLTNTLVFIGLVRPITWVVTKLVPDRRPEDGRGVVPKYLDDILIETPALALDRVRMELRRLGGRAHHMVALAFPVAIEGTREELLDLQRMDDEVDELYGAIVTYLGKVSVEARQEDQRASVAAYMAAANHIESIGDMIETNVVSAGLDRLNHRLEIGAETRDVLRRLHGKVTWSVEMALEALDASDPTVGTMVTSAKSELSSLAAEAEQHLANRLTVDAANRLALYRMESELIEYLKRVYYFAKRIARVVDYREELGHRHRPD